MAPGEEGFEEPRFAHSLTTASRGRSVCSRNRGGAGALAEPRRKALQSSSVNDQVRSGVPMVVAMLSVDFVFSVVGNCHCLGRQATGLKACSAQAVQYLRLF